MAVAEEWAKLAGARRIVVKVGTSTLTHTTGNLNLSLMERLVRQLVNLKNQGREVLLVTSAAVGAGMGRINIRERPESISGRQALAAIGQGILMHIYEKFFSEYGVVVAQVLLTKDDLADRQRYLNARTTLRQIMIYGAVPIINENDTVAFDQIKFGDNDTLSAMVAGLADADLLVLLSDIDGLYTKDPRVEPSAQLIPLVQEITPEIEALAGGTGSQLGSGGMKTKIAAARIAVSQGIPMVLTDGSRRDCLGFLEADDEAVQAGSGDSKQAGSGEPGCMSETAAPEGGSAVGDSETAGQEPAFRGTLFLPKTRSLGSRKGWLALSTRPAGTVVVDEGASKAILEKGTSLLPSGVRTVEGDFPRGEIVEIRLGQDTIARGVVNFSSEDIRKILGRHSREIEGILGPGHEDEIIHRDNLSSWK